MAKSLVFDTSTIITLVTNNLLWILKPLKEKFNGDFYISESVKNESVDVPLNTKKFKFEAVIVMESLKRGDLKLSKEDISEKTDKLLFLANHVLKAKDEWINIVHKAEMESLALASILNSEAYVVDERTIRLLIENPRKLAKLLNKKLHTRIEFNAKNLREFQREIGRINIIRSVDLMVLVYELGLLNKYAIEGDMKKNLLEGILWGAKLRGCAVSVDEINDIMRLEGFQQRQNL